MKIKSLTLINFKKFDKVNLTFKEISELHGSNGTGKTSILEAICVAYYGKLPDGTADISKLIRNGEEQASIIVEDEVIGQITRNIKVRGSELLLDGQKVSQDNFQSLYRLVPSEYFLAAVNPNYWKDLDYKDRRSILGDLTPKVDRSEVFKAIYPERLLEKFTVMTYQEVNGKIKSINSLMDQTRGNIQQIKIDLRNPVKIEEIKVDFERLQELKERKEKYEVIKVDWNRLQTVEEDKKLVEQYNEAVKRMTSIDSEIDALAKNYSIFESENKNGELMSLQDIRQAVSYRNAIISAIAKKEAESEMIMRKYADQKKAKETGICPVCGTKLKEEEAHDIKEDVSFMKLTDEILELKEKLERIEVWEEELKDYDRSLDKLNTEKQSLSRLAVNDRMKSLSSEIEDLLKRKESISKGYSEVNWSEDLEIELKTISDNALKSEGAKQAQSQNADKSKVDLEGYNKKMDEYEEDLQDLNTLQEALGPKGIESEVQKRKAKFIEESVGKYAGGIEIETVEELKSTDGYKEVFNVFKNGVQEKKLSTGQKMTLAVAFCLAIQDLLEKKFGYKPNILFMDDSSLITSLEKIRKVSEGLQQFYAVNTQDAELKLSIIE